MLLNFQRVFARSVWEGKKRQTIRSAGQRQHVPAIGDTAHCYTGLRTRRTLKLGSWPIERVDVLRMDVGHWGLRNALLGAQPLSHWELMNLAVADGFASSQAMGRWFAANHPPGEFYGWVIG
ncbi:hypothetical protein [Hydrogenophaga sp.]|uniref:hypothetical protein n=1 Tax=Hydrogenophaga sp. TaxID=1904254 RepID=UPI003D14A422